MIRIYYSKSIYVQNIEVPSQSHQIICLLYFLITNYIVFNQKYMKLLLCIVCMCKVRTYVEYRQYVIMVTCARKVSPYLKCNTIVMLRPNHSNSVVSLFNYIYLLPAHAQVLKLNPTVYIFKKNIYNFTLFTLKKRDLQIFSY